MPFGAAGEIYVAGPGLSEGYLNHTELTRGRYIERALLVGSKKQRLYKTGDLGRYRNDENIEFLGRADQQVKLRGYRIELDEIESVLLKHPMINNAVVAITSHKKEDDSDFSAYTSSTEDLMALITKYATTEEGLEMAGTYHRMVSNRTRKPHR